MRPREKGKLRDLATSKLLTPGLSPGRLPESSQKSLSQTSHLVFVSVTSCTRCHSRCSPFPFVSMHRGEERSGRKEGEMRATEDGSSWWLKLNTPPRNFLLILIFFPPPPFLSLPSHQRAPKTRKPVNEWETRWQEGAKWIWVMGSWAMCLFNHLVATPSV